MRERKKERKKERKREREREWKREKDRDRVKESLRCAHLADYRQSVDVGGVVRNRAVLHRCTVSPCHVTGLASTPSSTTHQLDISAGFKRQETNRSHPHRVPCCTVIWIDVNTIEWYLNEVSYQGVTGPVGLAAEAVIDCAECVKPTVLDQCLACLCWRHHSSLIHVISVRVCMCCCYCVRLHCCLSGITFLYSIEIFFLYYLFPVHIYPPPLPYTLPAALSLPLSVPGSPCPFRVNIEPLFFHLSRKKGRN